MNLRIKRFLPAFKISLKLIFLAIILGSISLSFLYHNDAIYSKILNYNKAYIQPINTLGEKTDVIGGIKNILNPIPGSNYVHLEIEEKNFNLIKSGIEENPRKKPWSKAKLLVDNQLVDVEICLHGSDHPHYENNKFSYKIKTIGNQKLINGWRKFTLIKGEEGDPSIAVVNSFAKKLGLISSYGKMVMLTINDSDAGHYYLVEKIDPQYIEENFGLTNTSILRNTSNWTRKEGFGSHMTEFDLYAGHIRKQKTNSFKPALKQFSKIRNLIDSNNVDGLKKLFNIKYIGKYIALATIFNDNHFFTGDNLKLVYDSKSEKFYPIYRAEKYGRRIKTTGIYHNITGNFDKFLFDGINEEHSQSLTNKIFKLLLSDSSVYVERNKNLAKFVLQIDSIKGEIKHFFKINNNVLSHSTTSRRSYQILQKSQLKIVSKLINHAQAYLKYVHIYGTYDDESNVVSFKPDCFSNIKVYYNNVPVFKQPLKGISVQADISLKYSTYQFLYEEAFNPKKLVIVNMSNNDTVSKKFINLIPI